MSAGRELLRRWALDRPTPKLSVHVCKVLRRLVLRQALAGRVRWVRALPWLHRLEGGR